MAFLAVARALSSSPRLFTSASKSSAFSMQLECSVAFASWSACRSLDVAARSPSAVAFAPWLAARPFLASSMSLSPFLISSARPCFSISKLWTLAVSALRSPSSCFSAFSSKSLRASMMPPLCPSYVDAAGAPESSSSEFMVCSSPLSLLASVELSNDARTITERACVTLAVFLSCTNAAPPALAISRSRMLMARFSVSTISISSPSSASKSACSFSRMVVAALRSAVSLASSPARSSTFALNISMLAVSFSTEALSSATSASAVLISKPSSRARSSHHSENSANTAWDASPSPMTLACRSEIISRTLPMGDAFSAAAAPSSARASSLTEAIFVASEVVSPAAPKLSTGRPT
mmetsp:Transcript_96094/g.253782  ORF Transcript_96094/g.253782 Transcript_96094/m.253782 type:complete len:352 (+) Transcript_96094:1013-2068(+)